MLRMSKLVLLMIADVYGGMDRSVRCVSSAGSETYTYTCSVAPPLDAYMDGLQAIVGFNPLGAKKIQILPEAANASNE